MATTASTVTSDRGLRLALWVVQVALAGIFGIAGATKAFQAQSALIEGGMAWVADVPFALVRFIGASELAGALGLILPAATRIRPTLTPLAAIGLIVVMVLAAAFHASRGEWGMLPANAALAGLASFVAWGRLVKAPIPQRG